MRRPEEDHFVKLAQEEPSFGGYFVDSLTGSIVVYMADSARLQAGAALVERYVESISGTHRMLAHRSVGARPAKYSFQQLSDWRDIVVDSLLGRYGVLMDDADEVHNRVTIGIDSRDPEAKAGVITRLDALGIPLDAVRFENALPVPTTSPGVASASTVSSNTSFLLSGHLYDATDTLAGGFDEGPGSAGCTASIGADSGGVRVLLQAAHGTCVGNPWGTDTATFYSPFHNPNGKRVIGHGRDHANRYACGAFNANHCIKADLAITGVSGGQVTVLRGAIARPLGSHVRGSGNSILAITPVSSWINMTGGADDGIDAGIQVEKIGYVSGWTFGFLQNTCVDQEGTDGVIRVCSDKASTFVQEGDSGSPAFWWDGTSGGTYLGIVWGENSAGTCNSSGCNELFFSPFTQMLAAFPGLNVRSAITVGAPSASGSIGSGGTAVQTWSAVTATNTTATTQYRVWRFAWDASRCNWLTTHDSVGVTTSTTLTDPSPTLPLSSYAGTTQPDPNTYSLMGYWVEAYNDGIGASSPIMWFQGSADGPGGTGCNGGPIIP